MCILFLYDILGCIFIYLIFQYADYYNEYDIIPINNSEQNKEINELKEELNKAKKTIEQLTNKIKELENQLKTENEFNLNKIQSLQNLINKKDEELNKLKEQLQNNNIINNNNQNNSIKKKGGDKCVNIISNDQKIFYAIPCSGDDIFAEIEEILYKEYPEYRETNNMFLANGKEILRFKSISDNNIGAGKPIMLIQPS